MEQKELDEIEKAIGKEMAKHNKKIIRARLNKEFAKRKVIEKCKYDYEDMKLAIVVQDFFSTHPQCKSAIPQDYEDIIYLTQDIKDNWLHEKGQRTLTEEEYAYIQTYAYRFLEETQL